MEERLSRNNISARATRDLYGGKGGNTKLFSKGIVYELQRVGKETLIIKDDIGNMRTYNDIIKDKKHKNAFEEITGDIRL